MKVRRRGGQTRVWLDTEPRSALHRPSVDVLMASVARTYGARSMGIVLTGMGADGAKAMKEMRDAGSYNYAQDEASCVVFGMPREAIARGAIDEILPLSQLGSGILRRIQAKTK